MHNRGPLLYQKAKRLVPGGTQLLSKRPEMFIPDRWPAYYSKCNGISVWDLDGRKYYDFTISGVGACTLGYCDPDVDRAVFDAVKKGNMCTLNAPEEVALAELLCDLHPWAQMVRYARTGGEAMAIAIRIVRAYTGKEKILFCGYHGWHDWYLSANLGSSTALDGQLLPGLDPRGVPRELRNTALPFVYNSIASFKKMVEKHGNNIAAVVMEPVRSVWPNPGFLDQIREITRERKIPLVFDEITSGFRMLTGGVHLSLGVMPDVAVFAKALGNGFPMAAIIGKGAIMQAAQKTFISSTYWTDRIGPTAALATLKKHSEKKVGRHLVKIGSLVQAGWGKLAKKHNLSIKITGIPPLSHWHIEAPQSDLAHTFIANKMLEKGFLTSRAFYPTNSHSEDSVRRYLSALDEILEYSAPYIHQNAVHRIYRGPVAHAGFKRLT